MRRDDRFRPILCRLWLVIAWIAVSGPVAADALSVSGAWARASPPGVDTAAVYFRLQLDETATRDRLVGVRTPRSGEASLHASVRRNGQVRMVALDGVALTPGTGVDFEPGGRHVMLTGLAERLTAGERITLVLELEQRGEHKLEVPVRPLNATGT